METRIVSYTFRRGVGLFSKFLGNMYKGRGEGSQPVSREPRDQGKMTSYRKLLEMCACSAGSPQCPVYVLSGGIRVFRG